MKLGIIGVGNIGGTLGKLWATKGHTIMFGAQNTQSSKVQALLDSIGPHAQAGTVAQAATFGEAILLAVPADAVPGVIQQAGDLSGKILIDATNRMTEPPPGSAASMGEEVARLAPGARVVKAFNSLGAGNLTRLQFGSQNADAFICGDDPEAKAVVAKLAQEIGFDVVDVGPLSNAVLVEALAKLIIQLAYGLGMGPDIAFKLLKR